MTPLGASRYIIRGAPRPTEPPPVGGGTSTWDLTANPAFNPAAPTLKNGSPFQGRMSAIYDGLINHYINGPGVLGRDSETNIEQRLGSGNSYAVGRGGFRGLMPLTVFFRLTGDLRILDEMARLGQIAYNSMRTSWHPDTSVTRTFHGKRTWVWTQGPSTQNTSMWGTDDHLTDTHRAFAALAPVALALHKNRALTSPAGHNYAALADAWIAAYEGFEQVWTADPTWDANWPAGSDVPTTYKGYWTPSGYQRPAKDQWPTNRRTFTHSNHGAMSLAYYMGQLLGKPENVYLDGTDQILQAWIEHEAYTVTTGIGDALAFSRTYTSLASSNNYLMPITYAEYTFMDLVALYLDGNPRSRIVPAETLRLAARSYAWWVYKGNLGTWTAAPDIGGGIDRTGTNKAGRTLTLPDACEGSGGSFCSDRSRYQASFYGHNLLLPWDDTGIMDDYQWDAWSDYLSGDGTFAEPLHLTYPAGAFLKDAGIM